MSSLVKRNSFIDILKGLAIFLMLWGHSIQFCSTESNIDFFENYVFKFIYSFHMPLLMIISGYLFYFSFSKRNAKELIIHRGASLLHPIIFYNIANFLLTDILLLALQGKYNEIFTLDKLKEFYSSFYSFWFLWSVLLSSILIAVICKYIHSPGLQLILLMFATAVFLYLPNTNRNIFVYPYFVLGFYYSEYKDRIPDKLKIFTEYISLVLFPVLLLFYKKSHYIYTTGIFNRQNIIEQTKIDLYRWIIGIVGIIFIIAIVRLTGKISSELKLFRAIRNGLISLGKNSLRYYCISTTVLSFWLPVIIKNTVLPLLNMQNILPSNPLLYNFIITPIITILYCFIIHFIIVILKKIKLDSIFFYR